MKLGSAGFEDRKSLGDAGPLGQDDRRVPGKSGSVGQPSTNSGQAQFAYRIGWGDGLFLAVPRWTPH